MPYQRPAIRRNGGASPTIRSSFPPVFPVMPSPPHLRTCLFAAITLCATWCVSGAVGRALRHGECGPLQARLRCIERTVPVLQDANCSQWTGKPFYVEGLKYDCRLGEMGPEETARLLDGSAVAFLGSGTRFAAYSLISRVTGRDFESFNVSTVTVETVTTDDGSFVVSSHEEQEIRQLLDLLPRQPGVFPDAFTHMKNAIHRIFVLSYAAHDLQPSWRSVEAIEAFVARGMSRYVDLVMAAVSRMKRSTLVRPGRDYIIFQESRPVGPASHRPNLVKLSRFRRDPVNDQLAAVGRAIKFELREDHPDVAFLDMQWLRARNGIGRHVCAPFDLSGSRFTSEITRTQADAQILYAIKLLMC